MDPRDLTRVNPRSDSGEGDAAAEVTGRDFLKPFLLQRLTDRWLEHHTILPGDSVPPAPQSLSEESYREAVVGDLRRLLNTIAPPAWTGRSSTPRLAASVLNYGLPDFSLIRRDDVQGQRFCSLIRQAITRFEPRMLPNSIDVELLETWGGGGQVEIVISGVLWALPSPQSIRLRTRLDEATQKWEISEQ